MIYKYNRGLTILELVIVISIIVIISIIIFPNLSSFRREQALKNTTEDIVSLLNKARNNTISSLNSNNYGVHFETDHVVLFAGSVFNDSSSSNEVVNFDSTVNIPATGGVNLNGGGKNVIFERITGETDNYGTIILQLKVDATHQKIININNVGVTSEN